MLSHLMPFDNRAAGNAVNWEQTSAAVDHPLFALTTNGEWQTYHLIVRVCFKAPSYSVRLCFSGSACVWKKIHVWWTCINSTSQVVALILNFLNFLNFFELDGFKAADPNSPKKKALCSVLYKQAKKFIESGNHGKCFNF